VNHELYARYATKSTSMMFDSEKSPNSPEPAAAAAPLVAGAAARELAHLAPLPPGTEEALQAVLASDRYGLVAKDDARAALIASADGDGRFLLGQAESLFALGAVEPMAPSDLAAFLHRRMPVYDKDREGHYGLISALHKSLRGSDPDAALYWLARMLVAGEEPLYLLRRLVRQAAGAVDWDLEVFELHHRLKADAPSGTALTLAEAAAWARTLRLPDSRV
jgi:hypothetical protein